MADIRDACRNMAKFCTDHKYNDEHLDALRTALRAAEAHNVVRGQARSDWWVAHAELVHAAKNVVTSWERSMSRPPALDILKIKLAQLETSAFAEASRDNGAYRRGHL
jgi:uncharacterized alpha-E superfamily protein